MEEYIELINKTNNILTTAEAMTDSTQRQNFLQENLSVFDDFKNSLHLILREYQFKEKDNYQQNEIANIVKNNIVKLLKLKNIFKKDTQYEYFESNLIEEISRNENNYAFRLQYENDMSKIEGTLQYLQERNDYIDAIKDSDLSEEEGITKVTAKKYMSNEFEKNIYGHILIQIRNNFLKAPKEQVVNIIKLIDNSSFLKETLSKDNKNMDFFEKNLIYQYSETVLKMKSIFTPDKLKDDIVIKQMWNGEIEDSKTLKNILSNISAKSFADISGYDDKKSDKGFILELSEHLKNVNLSNTNSALIMKNIFETQSISKEIAKFLAQIDIPKDYSEFLESKQSEEFEWLTDFNTFDSLKKSEKLILDAQNPFLPSEYYLKKLDRLQESDDISSHFVENLITLIHSDYYAPEEKESLINCLKENGLYNKDINNEKIIFEETDTPEIIALKVKQAYSNGQIIPIDIAQKIFNENLAGKNPIDKITLQGCVQSVICNVLKSNNIDIHNKVFFGDGNGTLGQNDPNNLSIWINDSLLEKYINNDDLIDKAELFKTMFHEMQHSIQYNNIKNGKTDYLTYNFIKEEIIEEYDTDFYNKNYERIFMESDARKEEILGALEFLNGLNSDFVKAIKDDMVSKYIAESEEYNIHSDSKKKFSIGKDNFIDISEYVGLLIQDNPKILEDNPVLNIEYNVDGTKKDIHTLLQEFEKQKEQNDTNYKDIYSI